MNKELSELPKQGHSIREHSGVLDKLSEYDKEQDEAKNEKEVEDNG